MEEELGMEEEEEQWDQDEEEGFEVGKLKRDFKSLVWDNLP